MKPNKQTPEQELRMRCQDIFRELAVWIKIKEFGYSDPFWKDGCNMNLTRNHIIHDKYEVERICAENGFELPEEYYLQTPPEVDNNYMANLMQKERVKRLRQQGMNLIKRKITFDAYQISMF